MNKKIFLSLLLITQYSQNAEAVESESSSRSTSGSFDDWESSTVAQEVEEDARVVLQKAETARIIQEENARIIQEENARIAQEETARIAQKYARKTILDALAQATGQAREKERIAQEQEEIAQKKKIAEAYAKKALEDTFKDPEQTLKYISTNQDNLERINTAKEMINPQLVDEDNNSLLMLALPSNNSFIIGLLLKIISHNINQVNTSEDSALTLAIKNRNSDVINDLLAHKEITFTENAHVIKEVMDNLQKEIQETQEASHKEMLNEIYKSIISKLRKNKAVYSVNLIKGGLTEISLLKNNDQLKFEAREELNTPGSEPESDFDEEGFFESSRKKASDSKPSRTSSAPTKTVSLRTIDSLTETIYDWTHNAVNTYKKYILDYEPKKPTRSPTTRESAFNKTYIIVKKTVPKLNPTQINSITRNIIIKAHSIIPIKQAKALFSQCPEVNVNKISQPGHEKIPFDFTITNHTTGVLYSGHGSLMVEIKGLNRELYHFSVILDSLTIKLLAHEYATELYSMLSTKSASSGYSSGSASSSTSSHSKNQVILQYESDRQKFTTIFTLTYKTPKTRTSVLARHTAP